MMKTIGSLLCASGLPPAEAKLLLGFALGLERAYIAAHTEAEVGASDGVAVERLFARRRTGEPVAYITEAREFFGLVFRVTPAVLIPRPETELLVERSLACLSARTAPRVLELGTGCGAAAIALAHARADAEIWATDLSPEALALAQENAARHGVRLRLLQSDWFEALAGERFDLIVSNPPYVASSDRHLRQGDVRFEPRRALVGGGDGLECIRIISRGARMHLIPGGRLIFEHGWDQGPDCERLLRELNYADVSDARDLAGHRRVCEGRFDP
ncbi:MAG: peptide chain release factor N(5)-glutamine methyltransferase [Betaproteobacteria bacterium]|nr:peptide chain release factor N(5)-glutamine methyltransferase [Betaproteobacteria bacterium]